MCVEMLLAALELSTRQLLPLVAAVAAGLMVWLIITLTSRRDERTDERLERFGRVGAGAVDAQREGGRAEKLDQLLEKAADFSRPLTPKTEEQQSELKIRLANGGWRGESAAARYLGIKFILLVLGLTVGATVFLPAYGMAQKGIIYSVLSGIGGFYIPNVFLWWRIKTRQEAIFFGLPDALDLMVVCVESGLGLDAAMRKVCEEMGGSCPIISEEFSICNFQLQMGRPRRDVLHDLGVRTGVDDMKALSAILIQADRFGSSIAQALRVQSDSMRVRRRQLAEERAAKTAVQLIFPLVLFIFPAVFIVLVGPAAIQIMDTIMEMGK